MTTTTCNAEMIGAVDGFLRSLIGDRDEVVRTTSNYFHFWLICGRDARPGPHHRLNLTMTLMLCDNTLAIEAWLPTTEEYVNFDLADPGSFVARWPGGTAENDHD